MSYLSRNEKAVLRRDLEEYGRKVLYEWNGDPKDLAQTMTSPICSRVIEHRTNEMDRHLQLRAKKAKMEDERRRAQYSGRVFYVCSRHQLPAKGHKPLQGQIFVDRFWRSELEDSGMSQMVPAVQDYIERNGTKTVQEVVGAPWYLITRPYCRHTLTAVDTESVLNGTAEAPLDHAHRSQTDAQRRAAYLRRRAYARRLMQVRVS